MFPKLVRLLGGQCHQKRKNTICIVVCNTKNAALRDRMKLHCVIIEIALICYNARKANVTYGSK